MSKPSNNFSRRNENIKTGTTPLRNQDKYDQKFSGNSNNYGAEDPEEGFGYPKARTTNLGRNDVNYNDMEDPFNTKGKQPARNNRPA